MELIQGSCTIMDHVKANTLGMDHRIKLFTQVCDAIKAAHDQGVLHLDLNASNILIDTRANPPEHHPPIARAGHQYHIRKPTQHAIFTDPRSFDCRDHLGARLKQATRPDAGR